MADTLETLEIKIEHSATGAASEIGRVADAIQGLYAAVEKSIPQLKEYASVLKDIGKTDPLKNMVKAAKQAAVPAGSKWAAEQTAKLESTDEGAKANILGSLDAKEISLTSETIKKLKDDISSVSHAFTNLGKQAAPVLGAITSAIKGAASWSAFFVKQLAKESISNPIKAIRNIGKSIGELGKKVKKSLPALSNFISSLKRIAMYRLLRTIIKEITEAFTVGLEHAYLFSQGITTDGHRFSAALDAMKTATSTMKNQLGSAFIALLTALAPIINQLISLITRLADSVSQLISAFTGSTYLKASEVPEQWAEEADKAGKAAKEWRNQLMGFDEINRLEAPTDSAKSAKNEIDPAVMFKDSPIKDSIKKFVDDFKTAISEGDWRSAGEMLGNAINSIFPSKDQWANWGSQLGYGLNGAIQTLYHFLNTVNFTEIGASIATFLNNALEQIDFTYLGAVLVRKFTAAIEFMLGFLFTMDWSLVGQSIGDLLRGAFESASEWISGQDWEAIGVKLFEKFQELIKGIDFASLAKTFFTFLGKAFAATVLLIGGFFENTFKAIKEYFNKKMEEAGGNAWEGFKKGIKDALANVVDWINDNIVTPFVEGVKSLLGIASPSTVFAEIGRDTVAGMQEGFLESWERFKEIVHEVVTALFEWVSAMVARMKSMIASVNATANANAAQMEADGSQYLQGFASGGFPEGEIFLAREAGPELVGTIGGRTAVANNDQIVAAVSAGVANAVSAVLGNSRGNSNGSVVLNINGREFARAIYGDWRTVEREHGGMLVANG